MTHHIWSIPVSIIFYIVFAWTSKKNSDCGGRWFYIVWVINCIPLWALVSRYSKNILFDGMLYDIILTLTYIFTMLYLGCGSSLSIVNKMGICIVIIGFIMMKVPK